MGAHRDHRQGEDEVSVWKKLRCNLFHVRTYEHPHLGTVCSTCYRILRFK